MKWRLGPRTQKIKRPLVSSASQEVDGGGNKEKVREPDPYNGGNRTAGTDASHNHQANVIDGKDGKAYPDPGRPAPGPHLGPKCDPDDPHKPYRQGDGYLFKEFPHHPAPQRVPFRGCFYLLNEPPHRQFVGGLLP